MLLNSYYTINSVQSEGDKHTFSIALSTEHPVYAGHFPSQPVSPGVCTLQMVRECAEQLLQKRLRISNISNCKYLSLITPQHFPQLQIVMQLTTSADSYKLDANVANAEAPLFKVKATLISL